MCGRFTLTNPSVLRRVFPQFKFPEFSETRLPRYNIAPAQDVLGVRNALAAFRSYGSTAPAEVKKQVAAWKSRLGVN